MIPKDRDKLPPPIETSESDLLQQTIERLYTQRIPASILDQNKQVLATGEAFIHKNKSHGAFFQTYPQEFPIEGSMRLLVEKNVEIPIHHLSTCKVDGWTHISFHLLQ